MELSINKTLKNNLWYVCLVSVITYIIHINSFVYMEYWFEKFDRELDNLDSISSEVYGRGYPIDFSDYSDYGPSWDTVSKYFFISYSAIPFYFIILISSILYIIIPLVLVYINYERKITFIIIDICFWTIYLYIYTYSAIEKPLYGFVPTCILHPMLTLMMIWFRFKQYKNIYGKDKVQKNE